MNSKKVLGFIFCSSAFTKRNFSSMILVGMFFLVYILAGGKIDTKLPKPTQGGAFGGVDDIGSEGDVRKVSKEVLGIVPTESRKEREQADLERGRVFTNDEAQEGAQEPIDKSGLIVGKKKVYGSERERIRAEREDKFRRESVDPFAAIEERLHKRGQE